MIAALATMAAIAAEAIAIYVVAAWLGAGYDQPDKHAVSAFSLVGAALLGFWTPRGLAGFDFSARTRWILGVAIAFVAIYGVLRLEFGGDLALWDFGWVADFLAESSQVARDGSDAFAGTIFLLIAWSWASVRSERDLELQDVPKMLSGPFGLVVIVTVVAAPSSAGGEVGRAAAAFFAVAIVALALSQSARSGATFGTLRAGGTTAILLAGTAVTTVTGLALFGLLWGPLSGPIGSVLGAVVGAVLTVILTPIAWLMEKVIGAILGDNFLQLDFDTRTVIDEAQGEETGEGTSKAGRVAAFLLRGLVLALVAALVIGVLLLFSKFHRRRVGTATEDGSAAISGNLTDDLKAAWHSLFRRGSRGAAQEGTGAIRLYREVLDRAEQQGHPRAPGTTAGEFAPELTATFHAPVTDEITVAFEQARYAGRPPANETLAALERRWRELRDRRAQG